MTDDELEQFEERAAIAEYHGGLSRRDAEDLAGWEVEGRRAIAQVRVGEARESVLDRFRRDVWNAPVPGVSMLAVGDALGDDESQTGALAPRHGEGDCDEGHDEPDEVGRGA